MATAKTIRPQGALLSAVAAAALCFFSAACQKPTDAEAAQRETRSLGESIDQGVRDFRAQADAKLQGMRDEFARLRQSIDAKGESVKASMQTTVDEIDKKMATAQSDLTAFKASATETANDAYERAKRALEDAGRSLQQAWDHVGR